jgi:2-oxoglutarate-Fe(II)-dependent oxygenase superfamily protein
MILQVTRSGVRVSGSPKALERLRAEFERRHFVRLRGFLSSSLLRRLSREIGRSEFYERVHSGIDDNKELCMRSDTTAAGLLHVLLNAGALFDVVEKITGCGSIGCFRGRVYRVVPGCGHRDAWHSDVARDRLVAMSVNLSPRRYRGGLLQLRSSRSHRLLREVPNPGFGDAILFRIADGLEHRISDIEGSAPKTAFAGWFHTKPSFWDIVRRTRGGRVPPKDRTVRGSTARK